MTAPQNPINVSADDYAAAARLHEANMLPLIRNADVSPVWLGDTGRFWYQKKTAAGSRFVLVDSRTGASGPAFDHAAVAAALNATLKPHAPASEENLGLQNPQLTPDGRGLVGSASGKRVSVSLEDHAVTALADTKPQDARLVVSPTGRHGIKRDGDNLLLVDLTSGREHRLTQDGEPYFSYGKLPDGALQTIVLKKAGVTLPPYAGAFSPDGRYFICPRMDERRLGVDPFIEQVPTDGSLRPVVHEVRRAFTGDQEQIVIDWFVFDIGTGERRRIQIPLGVSPAFLLGNGIVGWSLRHGQVFMLAITEGWVTGMLLRVDLATGKVTTVIEEKGTTCRFEPNTMMYNLPNVQVIGDGAEAIWYSDRSGWGHLYRYDAQSGELLNPITGGDWMLFDIHHVDEGARRLYFTAGGREAGVDPYYRHLYRVGLDGSDLTLLTGGELHSDHAFAPSVAPLFKMLFRVPDAPEKIRPQAGVFIDTCSTVSTEPVTVLRSLADGALIAEIERADVSSLLEAGYVPPTRHLLKADDGQTDIPLVYFPPTTIAGHRAHPVIDACYGGPQVCVAPRSYVEAASASNPCNRMSLARLGFGVVVVDGRGTPARGNAFRDSGVPKFTEVGIRDHIAAIRQLAEQKPELDLDRVGIHGWSWGGTFSAQAILTRSDFYRVCITGAGVYDYGALYSGFESSIGMPIYADGSNHRGSPSEKPLSWAPIDITGMAAGMNGKILIVWGDADENVPPSQAYRLIDALIQANKPYDALILPNKTHGTASQYLNPYTAARTWDYYVEHLMRAPVPDSKPFQCVPRPGSF
ncbi:prolyl oligopeptidase family serine peptidase [Solimonas sp. SE-A11]|uniref:S9 family peptidase n=1 Tax=Solimonas sp. SE-A11 TaxID=3054954 RepID=UPI00259CCCAA|nr:prolyl oligopeptidase family serine peptidase [Solimonas sp. SE-A11]MDM4769907.1 prolyl oligopeptidase family serine peptidase [Solimonas sp. SE-A11]